MVFEFILIFILLFIIFGLVYQFMFDIWIKVLIISIVFFVSYVSLKIILNKHKKTTENTEELSFSEIKTQIQPKAEDPAMKTLKPFISKNIIEGYKAPIIKDALLKQGWPKEKIDQAFKELKL